MKGIQDWLGDAPKADFAAEYFHCLPYSGGGVDASYRVLANWNIVEKILHNDDIDVMICRRGRQYDGDAIATGGLPRGTRAG